MWIPLGVDNFLLKHRSEDSEELFFVTDFVNIWGSSHSLESLVSSFKGFNTAVQWPDNKTAATLVVDLYSKESSNIKRSIEYEGMALSISSYSSTSVYKYKMCLRFNKMTDVVLYHELTYYLMSLLNSFQDRERRLIKIVEDKDVELEEYRQEGVEIKRRGVVTAPFVYEAFDLNATECSATELFNNPTALFSADFQKKLSKLPQLVIKKSGEEESSGELPVENLKQETSTSLESSSLYLDSPIETKRESAVPIRRKRAYTGLKL